MGDRRGKGVWSRGLKDMGGGGRTRWAREEGEEQGQGGVKQSQAREGDVQLGQAAQHPMVPCVPCKMSSHNGGAAT